jgi:hypothetical protein
MTVLMQFFQLYITSGAGRDVHRGVSRKSCEQLQMTADSELKRLLMLGGRNVPGLQQAVLQQHPPDCT